MGCDIHLHTEVKIHGKWEHYGSPNVPRDYGLFALMAGVRKGNDDKPISLPRGLPKDVSTLTKFASDYMGSDGHSHSYLNANEIIILEKYYADQGEHWPERRWGYLFGNSWGGFIIYPEERPSGIEDVRFVFWFDN